MDSLSDISVIAKPIPFSLGGQTLKEIARPTFYSPAGSINPTTLLSNRSSVSRQVAVALQHLASQYSLKIQNQMTHLRKEITT
jgi:hypothetical protein